ncbi:MAG: uridylate kinase [Methanomicrobiales archaeon]|nr:uridylate kinase [Methanomicrobiales archaeon]
MPAGAVVKVGGSLFSEVPRLVQEIRSVTRPVLVVPGGGQYADLVRMLSLPEEQSHWMAIAAMEQYAWYIAVHGMETMDGIAPPEGIRVLLPYRVMRVEDPLPHTWDVTSDSISAWVAYRLDLPLLLLKSVDGLTRDGRLQHRVSRAFPCGEVDPYFLPFVLSRGVPVTVANGRVAGRAAAWLRGEEVSGTVIGPEG